MDTGAEMLPLTITPGDPLREFVLPVPTIIISVG